MQLKSFTAWCNLHLAKAGLKAENLIKDFGDGIMLLRLVEVISEDNLGRYNKKPVRCRVEDKCCYALLCLLLT